VPDPAKQPGRTRWSVGAGTDRLAGTRPRRPARPPRRPAGPGLARAEWHWGPPPDDRSR
jgi:hypothetical protein